MFIVLFFSIYSFVFQNSLSEDAIGKLSPASSAAIHRKLFSTLSCFIKEHLLGDFFEISALFAILKKDLVGFEKSIVDVQSFYTSQANDSTNKYLMTGLHLMFLLVKDRLSEFHMLLEQIDQHLQQTNPYVVYLRY